MMDILPQAMKPLMKGDRAFTSNAIAKYGFTPFKNAYLSSMGSQRTLFRRLMEIDAVAIADIACMSSDNADRLKDVVCDMFDQKTEATKKYLEHQSIASQ